jgi:zinc transport system substrate-binding protein
MKKTLLASLSFIILASCQTSSQPNGRVLATLFPQFSIAKNLLKDIAEVDFLLDNGQTSHDFEPTPSDVVALNQASIVFFTSESLEPWIHNIENTAKGRLVDVSSGIVLLEGHGHEEEVTSEADDEHGEYDPHYWIDPANALYMLETISTTLIEQFPNEEALLLSRTQLLEEAFQEITQLYETLVPVETELDIVFAGHNVFSYLETYRVHIQSPYAGFSDDVVPTAESLTEFISLMSTLETSILYVSSTDNQAVIDALLETNPSFTTEEIFSMEAIPSSLDVANTTYQEMLLLNYEAVAKSL